MRTPTNKNFAPFRYSELYYQWRGAIKENRMHDAAELSARHCRAFGVKPYKKVVEDAQTA